MSLIHIFAHSIIYPYLHPQEVIPTALEFIIDADLLDLIALGGEGSRDRLKVRRWVCLNIHTDARRITT